MLWHRNLLSDFSLSDRTVVIVVLSTTTGSLSLSATATLDAEDLRVKRPVGIARPAAPSSGEAPLMRTMMQRLPLAEASASATMMLPRTAMGSERVKDNLLKEKARKRSHFSRSRTQRCAFEEKAVEQLPTKSTKLQFHSTFSDSPKH
jgi:hypothetical protein